MPYGTANMKTPAMPNSDTLPPTLLPTAPHLSQLLLTSSLVVTSEAVRYEWKPASPTTDQMEKKHTKASITVQKPLRKNGTNFFARLKYVF